MLTPPQYTRLRNSCASGRGRVGGCACPQATAYRGPAPGVVVVAVARARRHTLTCPNACRARVVRIHVNLFRICRGVAERLHHQVSREAQ
ncbi:hypothetical protein, partial [Escherichia coli]|uniref:hypothetical protein n=1 Tax=Escherichia coli TaxID=562 RepID=UPI0035DB95AE